ncbi:MAG: hypothetical protein P8010_01825 [Desulfosarcinaceae bacterium]|jgi:hypothetical protein
MEFFIPYRLSAHYFRRIEGERILKTKPVNTFEAYLGPLDDNLELPGRSLK